MGHEHSSSSQRWRPHFIASWRELLASLWFLPTLIVASSFALAISLVELSARFGNGLSSGWPLLLGASAEGARSMLSAIATSMASVAGVVFSVTIVALSLASSQYSPRVLSNFMSDRPTQSALGVFVGAFTYCLVVMRAIRSPDEGGGFVPSLAVAVGVALALCGIGVLIFFIHHVASSIAVSSVLERIGNDTSAAIRRLFPDPVGEGAQKATALPVLPEVWTPVAAPRSGYLVAVHDQAVLSFAVASGRVVRFVHAMGDFVIEDQPMLHLSGDGAPFDKEIRRLHAAFIIGRRRTVEQDAPYGLQQLVDIALRALSPGVNDPTTACMCLDQLTRLWVQLATRQMPSSYRWSGGELRLVVPCPAFETVFFDGFESLASCAAGSVAVWERLLLALERLGEAAGAPRRMRVIQQAASMLKTGIDAGVGTAEPRRRLSERVALLQHGLRREDGGRSGDHLTSLVQRP